MTNLLVLRALTGPLRGKEFSYRQPTHLVIGRSRSCHLQLPDDPTVSRQHCLLEMGLDGVWVLDLSSRNGTLVNGAKIGQRPLLRDNNATMIQPDKHQLEDGDELRICSHVFAVRLFEVESEASPLVGSSVSSTIAQESLV
jgi:pSer/pThr/pTyr-binding forkhead associated (FHA) protein